MCRFTFQKQLLRISISKFHGNVSLEVVFSNIGNYNLFLFYLCRRKLRMHLNNPIESWWKSSTSSFLLQIKNNFVFVRGKFRISIAHKRSSSHTTDFIEIESCMKEQHSCQWMTRKTQPTGRHTRNIDKSQKERFLYCPTVKLKIHRAGGN